MFNNLLHEKKKPLNNPVVEGKIKGYAKITSEFYFYVFNVY